MEIWRKKYGNGFGEINLRWKMCGDVWWVGKDDHILSRFSMTLSKIAFLTHTRPIRMLQKDEGHILFVLISHDLIPGEESHRCHHAGLKVTEGCVPFDWLINDSEIDGLFCWQHKLIRVHA